MASHSSHRHDHGHAHGHGHSHDAAHLGDGRLMAAVGVNVLLTFAQIVGGVLSGSLSLIADAIHNLSDAASLALALAARRIARRASDKRRTFGYRRAELIGALMSLTSLILVGLYLVYEAVERYFNPAPIEGWTIVIVAGIALVIDLVTAMLTFAESKHSVNIRAAFLHNVSDALASVGVIIAGTLIILYQLYVADLIVTVAIALYVLYHGFAAIVHPIRILMDSVPEGVDFDELIGEMEAVEGVGSIHHLHIRALDERRNALEAHVVIDQEAWRRMEDIKGALKNRLERLGIGHSTLEFEFAAAGQPRCADHSAVPRH